MKRQKNTYAAPRQNNDHVALSFSIALDHSRT